MHFADREAFLVLQLSDCSNATNGHKIKVVPSADRVIAKWTASTRVSPVFCVEELGKKYSPSTCLFPGKGYLVFVGPVHPDTILARRPQRGFLWLTLGLFNAVVSVSSRTDLRNLLKWCKKENHPFDAWRIDGGIAHHFRSWSVDSQATEWRKGLSSLSNAQFAGELKESIQEYCPLMASTLARSVALPMQVRNELHQISDEYDKLLREFKERDSEVDSRYQALGQVLTFNAGLSRFSSQTFAGTSPIAQTECHFWQHSFLGIGVATLAFRKLRQFLGATLGSARIPQRFAKFEGLPNDVPDFKDLLRNPTVDYFASVTPDEDEPIIPTLTYFSGRDGYHSTETTISAPLAAVSSCNSRRWSLLTVTHEIAHMVIRAVLSEILPDLHNESSLSTCLELLDVDEPTQNLLAEIRRQLLFTMLKMDEAVAGRTGTVDLDTEKLRDLIQRWRQDVDEIMTHVFDFIYCYGSNAERYVGGIWASWGTVPNVSSRVRDYVVRTICAVLSGDLRRGKIAEETAKTKVLRCLTDLQDHNQGGRYINEAIEHIENCWETEIKERVKARRTLVKIVRCFLFSQTVATAVRAEPEIKGGESETQGYALRTKRIDSQQIRNPLRFIESYTKHSSPSVIESVWMLYVLAFCVYDHDG